MDRAVRSILMASLLYFWRESSALMRSLPRGVTLLSSVKACNIGVYGRNTARIINICIFRSSIPMIDIRRYASDEPPIRRCVFGQVAPYRGYSHHFYSLSRFPTFFERWRYWRTILKAQRFKEQWPVNGGVMIHRENVGAYLRCAIRYRIDGTRI